MENKTIKVLAITRSPINSNDNLGSTLEKLLGCCDQIELSSIYLRSEEYRNTVCNSVYQIPEQELFKSAFSKRKVGKKLNLSELQVSSNYMSSDENKEKKYYDIAKSLNFHLLWVIRELLWKSGKWRCKTFCEFLHDLNPDLVFFVSFNCWYPYDIMQYVMLKTNAPLVVFHVDDNYSISGFHLSPFYWIHKTVLRKKIRKAVELATMNYCISISQKEYYDSLFNVNSKILQKAGSFNEISFSDNPKTISCPLRIVFTGNISSGRWKTLGLLAEALDEININEEKALLYIYTQNSLSKKQRMVFSKSSIKEVRGIDATAIPQIQHEADILVHVESFDKKDISAVRFSFSTKIVDYLSRGKCVLAIGPSEDASIRYFIDNSIGFPITDKDDISNKIKGLLSDHALRNSIARASYEISKSLHDSSRIQAALINDFISIGKRCNS